MRRSNVALIPVGLFVLTLVIPACSSSRLVEATRPAQPSSVNAVTDSIRLKQLPPVPVRGVPTEPLRVTRYDSLDAPSADVQRVTYAPDAGLTVLFASGAEMKYRPPEFGETLDVIATSDSTARAQVRGQPEDEKVEVVAPEPRDSFWDRVKANAEG